QVRIGETAAPAGLLLVGFTAEGPGSKGGIRWLQAEVTAGGQARVENLKPGVYRVRRSYRPQEPPSVNGTGRWLNEESRVRVLAGRVVQLPPLRWAPAAR
ncbi:MAG TPA: hypothetical protein VK689_16755, partial [Armatimonadota bacterium]|nr:hypothetical protein [Armatimonadota bacterium]